MQEAELYKELEEVFSDVFMRDDIVLRPELTAKDVKGWDSLRQIGIILSLEQKFGIKFHPRDLDGLQTVGDLARAVLSKTSAQR
jgi:acyl carrier protein